MGGDMIWLGRKKLALVPLYRPNAHPPDQIPPDWNNQILRRVLFDPDATTGADPEAAGLFHAAGLVPKLTGANPNKKTWVFSQSPTAGHLVAGGSTVTMVLHTGPLP
jgi:hypothetical protein